MMLSGLCDADTNAMALITSMPLASCDASLGANDQSMLHIVSVVLTQ